MHGQGVVSDKRAEISGVELFWREAEAQGQVPVLYLHGVPTSSDDFLGMLERTGGIAPDLPGFGRSAKPAEFDYSIAGYSDVLEALLDHLAIERFSLLVHDWGAAGLALAQRNADRLARLVIVDAVPLFSDYRWHRLARVWRMPIAGELAMGITSPTFIRLLSRFSVMPPVPEAVLRQAWEHFDHGTQRAILKLYRSAPPERLGRAGAQLDAIRCPSLIVWGSKDPYIPVRFASSYASALGGAVDFEVADGAGHWPWLDQPQLVERITSFVSERD